MTTPPAEQPSASAMNVARCRAIAAHEYREGIRGPDTLAELFLDDAGRASLRDPATHALILKKLEAFSPGTYEYFIARTAYLDGVFEQALREGVAQILILGAGYDTRAYRFSALLQDARVFDVDSPATQQDKRNRLDQAHIATPDQLTFVTLDFTRDDLAARLTEAGFARARQTLVIWEGVSYYLPRQAVDDLLAFVRGHTPAGSRLCFDYMLPVSALEGRYGAQQARAAMQAMYTAEPLGFDLDESQVANFLADRGFALVEHLSAEQMQQRYLTLADGTVAGQMLDLFRLVQAVVSPA